MLTDVYDVVRSVFGSPYHLTLSVRLSSENLTLVDRAIGQMQLSFAGEWIFLRREALEDDTVLEHQLSIGTLHAIFLTSDTSFTYSWWLSRLLLRRLELSYVILLLISTCSICCSFTITTNFLLKFKVC